jgi:hypothetical protein
VGFNWTAKTYIDTFSDGQKENNLTFPILVNYTNISYSLVKVTQSEFYEYPNPNISNEVLTSYWSFDENRISGSTVYDDWGSNDLITNATQTTAQAKVNESVYYEEGDNSTHVFDHTGSYSYNMWVYINNSDDGGVVLNGNGNRNLLTISTALALVIKCPSGLNMIDTTTVVKNGWRMLTFTYDATTGVAISYYDSAVSRTCVSGSYYTNFSRIDIGRGQIDNYGGSGSGSLFDGFIDELAFYNNTVLNSSQITSLFQTDWGVNYTTENDTSYTENISSIGPLNLSAYGYTENGNYPKDIEIDLFNDSVVDFAIESLNKSISISLG